MSLTHEQGELMDRFALTLIGRDKLVKHFAEYGDTPLVAQVYETQGRWEDYANQLISKWRKAYGIELALADFVLLVTDAVNS